MLFSHKLSVALRWRVAGESVCLLPPPHILAIIDLVALSDNGRVTG